MNFFEDFGLFVVKILGFFAEWLDANIPLPWPIAVALLASVFIVFSYLVVWFLRGTVFPVACKHPSTTVRSGGDEACRRKVVGEWRYCFDHNGSKRSSNYKGKIVDPHLARWQTYDKKGFLVNRSDVGNNRNVGLLFCHGFARSPRNVINVGIPVVLRNFWVGVNNTIRWIRKQDLVSVSGPAVLEGGYVPSDEERRLHRATNFRGERMSEALYILKFLFPVTLLIVASTGFLKWDWWNYAALFFLWITVEIIHKGLLTEPVEIDGEIRHWGWDTIISATKKFLIFAGIALILFMGDEYVLPVIRNFLGI